MHKRQDCSYLEEECLIVPEAWCFGGECLRRIFHAYWVSVCVFRSSALSLRMSPFTFACVLEANHSVSPHCSFVQISRKYKH